MIPIQLTIEGLYSYQKKKQNIDFTALTSAGLFGIFGAVGSGKSSILEAISFALYGETERLNAKDKRSYNMMNLKSDFSCITFDFENFEGKVFRATREFKRNPKRFEEIRPATVVFYEQINNEWFPLNHSNAERLLQLSYDNFKRTIIIPQGKFKEFIELGPKDRTQMMKEIFNLHKYDLFDKVSVLNNKNLTELTHLQGKLTGFDEVSEEQIAVLNEKIATEMNIANEKQNLFKIVADKLQHLKNLKVEFEALQNKKNLFEALNHQKPIIDHKKTELHFYERVYKIFHQLLVDIKKCKNEILHKTDEVTKDQTILQKSKTEIVAIEVAINEIKPYYNNLPNSRLKEIDLESIVKICEFTVDVVELKNRTANGEVKVGETECIVKQLQQTIKETEKAINDLSKNKIETNVLINVGDWFTKKQHLEKAYQLQQQKKQSLLNEIKTIEKELISDKINSLTFEEDTKTLNDNFIQQKKRIKYKTSVFSATARIGTFCLQVAYGRSLSAVWVVRTPRNFNTK